MAVPTLPTLWADVLTQVNAFLAWDVVKGVIVLTSGLYLGSLAMRMIGRALH